MARAAKKTSAPVIVDTPPPPLRPRKIDTVLSLMRRTEGATLSEIVEVTGWLPHSARAALTNLRKAGNELEKTKRDETTCYRIVESA